jgi:hypothetical protein
VALLAEPPALPRLVGFITEQQLPAAEIECPGLARFFAGCAKPPTTFLELLWRFDREYVQLAPSSSGPAATDPRPAERRAPYRSCGPLPGLRQHLRRRAQTARDADLRCPPRALHR